MASKKFLYFQYDKLHEVRAFLNRHSIAGELSYWNAGSESEVDLIWSYGDLHIAIEIKSSKIWKSKYARGLNLLLTRKKISKAFAIYTGDHSMQLEGVLLLNYIEFLEKLEAGEVIPKN